MLKLLSRDAEIIWFKNISRTIGMLWKIKLSDSIKSEVFKVKESLDIILTHVDNSKKLNFNKIKWTTIDWINSKTVDLILKQVNDELIQSKNIDLDYLLLTKVWEQSEFLWDKVIENSDRLLEETDVIKVLEEISSWYEEDKMNKFDWKIKRTSSDFKKILEAKKEIDDIISKVNILEDFIKNVNDYRQQLSDLNKARINQEKVHKERINNVKEDSVNKKDGIVTDIIKKQVVKDVEEKIVIEDIKEFYSEDIKEITIFFEKCNVEQTWELFIKFIDNYYDRVNNTLKLGLIFLLKEKWLSKESLKDFFKKVDLIKLKDSDLKKWDVLDKYIYDRNTITEDNTHYRKKIEKVEKKEEKIEKNNSNLLVTKQWDTSKIDNAESNSLELKKIEWDNKIITNNNQKKWLIIVKKQGNIDVIDSGKNIKEGIKNDELESSINIDDMKNKLSWMSKVILKENAKEDQNIEKKNYNIEDIKKLIEDKKQWKFKYNLEKIKLILEYVNAEELKDFYLRDRKNFWTWNKHYNYYLYYCEAFERLECEIDPIFWQKSIDNLWKHVDKSYKASWDFNPRLREMVNRLREEYGMKLKEERKLEDNIEDKEVIEEIEEIEEDNTNIEEESVVIESEKRYKSWNSDIRSWNDVISEVWSSVVYVTPKAGKTSRGKLKVYWPIKSKWIILKWDERKHLEYKMMLEVNTMFFSRDRVFSKKSEDYIIDNSSDNIFIYELINRLSDYGSLDIITAFIKELYRLNLDDEFYDTLYENIYTNISFKKEELDEIEWFKKYAEEDRENKKELLNKEELCEIIQEEIIQEELELDNQKKSLEFKDYGEYINKKINKFLEEKDLEKLYSLISLFKIKDFTLERKINQLLLFDLAKEEIKNSEKIIKKILKILNK